MVVKLFLKHPVYELGVPGGALNLNSTRYPDHGHYADLPLQGKIPMVKPRFEPGTSLLVVRSSDHQATRLVRWQYLQMPKYCLYRQRQNVIQAWLFTDEMSVEKMSELCPKDWFLYHDNAPNFRLYSCHADWGKNFPVGSKHPLVTTFGY
jgi:hypothetical protein